MSGAELSWLAGLLEGEGTFRGLGSNRAIVRLAMCDLDVVQRAASLMGGHVNAYEPRNPRHRAVFIVSAGGSRAASLMRELRALLGTRRQGQVDAVLAAYRPTRNDAPPLTCAVLGCGRQHSSRGLCHLQYLRQWRAGMPAIESVVPDATSLQPGDAPERGLEWLAGLLEGEGWFRASGTPPLLYPLIGVQMTDRDVVDHAARLMGSERVYEDSSGVKRGWKVMHVATLGGGRAAALMRVLRPVMGERRGRAIDASLAAYHPTLLTEPPSECAVATCERPHKSRGLCHKHYMMWLRDHAAGRPQRITPLR
ncbi:hypothetical protein BH18CHL2_BH18CHL2_09310 [soil metagenome]